MTITARYDGKCKQCGGHIAAGAKIEWSKGDGSRHVKCPEHEAAKAETPSAEEGTIRLGGGSGYGCEGWYVGQVIVSGEKRRREGGPDGMVVVTARQKYVREDGLCFGVDDSSFYLYSATARPATAEELAPRIDDICEQAYRDAARAELAEARKQIEAQGERPELKNWPAGDTLYDTATGYGHGEAIVVGPAGIWSVRHNGADGDDWSHNNLPGCLGWRVDYDEKLATRLRSLVERAQLKA
jgi:hypothetical protein